MGQHGGSLRYNQEGRYSQEGRHQLPPDSSSTRKSVTLTSTRLPPPPSPTPQQQQQQQGGMPGGGAGGRGSAAAAAVVSSLRDSSAPVAAALVSSSLRDSSSAVLFGSTDPLRSSGMLRGSATGMSRAFGQVCGGKGCVCACRLVCLLVGLFGQVGEGMPGGHACLFVCLFGLMILCGACVCACVWGGEEGSSVGVRASYLGESSRSGGGGIAHT